MGEKELFTVWGDTVELNKDDIVDIDSQDEVKISDLISDLNNISLEVEGMEIPEWLDQKFYWAKLREHFIDKEED